jgi:tRNA A-37 threonylcarbamoyl transferase component Bud32
MIAPWYRSTVPEGFKRIPWGERHLILVREDMDCHALIMAVRAADEQGNSLSTHYGRGRLMRITLPDSGNALVRPYRHGGLFRWITGTLFCTWPARPFCELAVTQEIKRRGVPTVDVIAAVVEKSWGPFYRGWLVSRELTDARDLWLVLKDGVSEETTNRLLQAVAGAIRHMHDGGIYHPDLNVKNILVRAEKNAYQIYLIDFDKARLYPGRISSLHASRNLRRLLRSVQKLDPQRRYFSEEHWAALMESYYQGA